MADGDGITSKMSMQYFTTTLPIPPKLDVHGNLSANWKRFKRAWENYEIASHLNEQAKATRVATFLTCIGADALDIYDTFVFSDDEDKDDPVAVLRKFEAHCVGATNETFERYVFNQRDQEPGERTEAYVTALRRLAKTCNYSLLEDSLIRDRIVIGIQDGAARKRLLQEPNLTLKKCIDICHAAEITNQQLKTLQHAEIHAVKTTHNKSQFTKAQEALCKFCGKQHVLVKERCPAWGKRCMMCQGRNHFAVRCSDKNKKKPIHLLDESTKLESDTESVMVVETIAAIEPAAKRLFAKFMIGEMPVRFQLDCGATVNVLPQKIYKSVSRDYTLQRLQATNTKLVMYNKSTMIPSGKCRLTLTNPKNKNTHTIEVLIVNSSCNPILGARAVQEMDLLAVKSENIASVEEMEMSNKLTLDTILTQFPDVFQGDGTFEGKLHLAMDKTVPPVKLAVRKVPIAMKDKLKNELDDLVARKIITPVSTPTDWISSMVAVNKSNGKLRLCLDPKPLNKALKRNHYPLATIEDILPDLSRAKVFSLLDTKNGYWHVQLDESSSELTTFGTPWGRYRWLRMPFGIAPAPEEFQRHLDENLERLEGVKAVADDILVYGIGDSKEEALKDHDRKLEALLQRCRERNIKLNKNKLRLRLPEVRYMGFLISDKGLRCDPAKVEAITSLPQPTDKQGVQRLLGMTNFLQKFAPGLSTVVAPLRELLQKDNEFVWEEQVHGKCFNRIKQILSDAPVLRFFDIRAETHLQCDASEKGLGACLMQEGQPVAYASRSLTAAEINYAQIEKELLAIVFGMEKFEPYVHGRKVTVESDHKPLEAIMKKSLLSAPKRLQRMMLRLQKFDLHVVYKKGSQMFLADTLSRAYISHARPCEEDYSEVFTIERSKFEEKVESIDMTTYIAVSEETAKN
jgi:RNase H-like domain found in reverse transcriptase/Reverse transcriptase (RNA-dependent DNA polymerase)